MTRTCTICAHAQRHAIEKLIVGGTPNRRIAAQFNVAETSLRRHAAMHLPVSLVQAQEATETAQALDVLQQLRFINGAALSVLRDARTAGEGELVLKAIDRVMKQVELQAKLLGDLDDRPQVNIVLSPEWAQLRGRIVRALAPYPEVAVALGEVLGDVG